MSVTERWTTAGPIRTTLPMDVIEQEETRSAASVGEPAPLGLFGLASGTFTLCAVLAGWFPASTAIFASTVVFVFGGISQFIAGMWSYRKGDTFAATAFGSFGAFNTAYALYLWLHQAGLIVGPAAGLRVIGVFVACFALIATFLMVAALWKNMALVAVFFFLALTYALIAASYLANGATGVMTAGGWAGVIASLLAFYAAGAMVIDSASQRPVAPLGGQMFAEARDVRGPEAPAPPRRTGDAG